ncbi:MAG: hypothetical protein NT076_03840 [Candidatus Pacearchaeota archaeon]|nr:hypothetical protein [Candidatus Pacearchaeota archaeon]
MLDKKQKLKNIKDLEYNHLLSKQNVALVLIGTAIISIILIDKLPPEVNLTKTNLILILFLVGIGILLYFSKKLEDKAKEIKRI